MYKLKLLTCVVFTFPLCLFASLSSWVFPGAFLGFAIILIINKLFNKDKSFNELLNDSLYLFLIVAAIDILLIFIGLLAIFITGPVLHWWKW